MSNLGELLKTERTKKNINYDMVTDGTRISEDVLILIENGSFDKLPSYVHARNFVRTYASFLKLKQEEVDALFDEECNKELFDREVHYISSPVTHEPIEKKSPTVLVIAIVIALIFLISGVYFFASIKNNDAFEAKQTSEVVVPTPVVPKEEAPDTSLVGENGSIVDPTDLNDDGMDNKTVPFSSEQSVTPSTAVVSPLTPVAAPSAESTTAKIPQAPSGMRNVMLIFNDTCWVNVETDTGAVHDFIAEKGTEKTIDFKNYFVLNLGNAAAAEVRDNKTRFTSFGEYRKPVKNIKFSYDEAGNLVYQK